MGKRYTRLTQPMVRKSGELRPTSWDEALEVATSGFKRAIQQGTPNSFGIFSCSKATNELNFLAQKFARSVMGTSNIDSCNRT